VIRLTRDEAKAVLHFLTEARGVHGEFDDGTAERNRVRAKLRAFIGGKTTLVDDQRLADWCQGFVWGLSAHGDCQGTVRGRCSECDGRADRLADGIRGFIAGDPNA
jgi:hypothetical protein